MDLKAREQQVILLEKKLSNVEAAAHASDLELEGMVRQKKSLENRVCCMLQHCNTLIWHIIQPLSVAHTYT